MAPVSAPAKVLVTGANGYVAVWVTKALLESGYSVRGTVRSASKGEHLKKLFASYGDKLELVIVADITKVRCCDFMHRAYIDVLDMNEGGCFRRSCQGC